jgi:membrane dipeptidase
MPATERRIEAHRPRYGLLPVYLILTAAFLFIFGMERVWSSSTSAVLSDEIMVFDLHCDTLYQSYKKGVELEENEGHVDLKRMREGKYLAQVFAMWSPPGKGWAAVDTMARTFWDWKTRYGAELAVATTGSQVAKAGMDGRIAGVLGIEGLSPLEGDLGKMKELYDYGVRVVGLTWFDSNDFAGTSNSKDKRGNYGLTDKGRELVAMANELGMVIDVSHASDDTVRDVAKHSKFPFIASHSCARGIKDIERNLSDELLKLIAKKGGVVGVNFHRGFVADKPRQSIKLRDVVDQIVYMVKTAGIDAVGLGSDFDGASPPEDLDGADKMQDLASMLQKRGFSDMEVRKIMYLNALRVFTRVTENKRLKDILPIFEPAVAGKSG